MAQKKIPSRQCIGCMTSRPDTALTWNTEIVYKIARTGHTSKKHKA